MWLKIDDSIIFMNGDSVSSLKEIPKKVYKTAFSKMNGTFLKESEVKLEHGKIYGNSQKIANHIVESYKMSDPSRNLGVLLSGGRGLGKTLTTRLVIEQLKDEFPIILISEYTPDLSDFLSRLKGCVILMDEFEKFMGGNISGSDDEDEQTKQETILSCLDGNTGCIGNLFLLTVNNLYKVDENLKCRPGRIRYHYRYESESAEIVRSYCNDNLNRKELIEDVVKCLSVAKYVSLDIITAFVDELNKFPTLTPTQALEFFNIESSDTRYKIYVTVEILGNKLTYERTFRDYIDGDWCSLPGKTKQKYIDMGLPEHINITLDAENLPPYIYGREKLDVSVIELENISGYDEEKISIDDVHIISVVVEDVDFESFAKKYNKNSV